MSGPLADVHLTLCLTHDCNLRCRYCYTGTKAKRHMSLVTGRKAVDLAIARASGRLHLVFFGGEPLLRWGTLVGLTEYAAERCAVAGLELRPTVTTNGTLLTPERARWLKSHGFVAAISCDGTRDAHDANRVDARGRGSHFRTAKGTRTAIDSGLPVRVVAVLHPANVDDLSESAVFLRSLGAADIVVNPDWSADWSVQDLRDRWEKAYRLVAALWIAAFRERLPFWISFLDDKVATHLKGGYLASERCDLGRRNLVVAPSGRLYPCDRMVGDDDGTLAIGDVRSGTDAERVSRIVAGACRLPPECLECAVADRCRNRCACANLAMTGTLESPSETLCFHEQLAIRVADEAAATLFAEKCDAFVRRHYGSALE